MNLYERSLNYLFNHFGKVMPDSILLRIRYRIVFHKPLHLKNPKPLMKDSVAEIT